MKKLFSALLIVIFALTGCNIQYGLKEWMKSNNLIVSAHRGAHAVAPENTVESIIEAAELGYQAIEIDPRISFDKEIYLMHDETVDRTTKGSGKIGEMTSAEIESLEIDTAHFPKYRSKIVRVPKLEDAIRTASSKQLIVNIDGSKADWSDEDFVHKLIGILNRYDMFEQTFFVISNKVQRDFLIELYPNVCVSWLHNKNTSFEDEFIEARSYRHALLSIKVQDATDENISVLNESGIFYQVYGVNDIEKKHQCFKAGVPMIETDGILQ